MARLLRGRVMALSCLELLLAVANCPSFLGPYIRTVPKSNGTIFLCHNSHRLEEHKSWIPPTFLSSSRACHLVKKAVQMRGISCGRRGSRRRLSRRTVCPQNGLCRLRVHRLALCVKSNLQMAPLLPG